MLLIMVFLKVEEYIFFAYRKNTKYYKSMRNCNYKEILFQTDVFAKKSPIKNDLVINKIDLIYIKV